jgi:hypothetical protein
MNWRNSYILLGTVIQVQYDNTDFLKDLILFLKISYTNPRNYIIYLNGYNMYGIN